MTSEELNEWNECGNDILYFTEKYIKINTCDNGIVNINLYDYQKNLLDELCNDNNFMILYARQIGMSVCQRIYILWYALFHADKNIGIFSIREEMARASLVQFKDMYRELPDFMKDETIDLNNASRLVLGNGTTIYARSVNVTGTHSILFNKVYVDNIAYGSEERVTDFMNALLPTITSSNNSNIIISSTPNGKNYFYDMWKRAQESSMFSTIELNYMVIPTRDTDWENAMRRDIGDRAFRQEFLCEFVEDDE